MNEKFTERQDLIKKKKMILKMMEDGRKLSLSAKRDNRRFKRIKKLSNY